MGLFEESTYVSQKALQNLKLYKYASVDKSPTTKYLLRYYWDWAVKFFPLWMAPNLITLCGLMFVILNLICVMVYIPDLETPAPSWLYFSFAAGLWLYSTFDNVDGRQARRTKTSSPLGELFDHGCDALNCSYGSIVQAASMGFGHSWYSAFVLLIIMLPFYLSTWEEYHTGILYLGYVNGPTEGLILACLTMALSGIYGPGMWFTDLRTFLGSLKFLVPSIISDEFTLADLLVVVMTSVLIFVHSPACFSAVYKSCRARKQPFFLTTIVQNIPMIIIVLAGYLWLQSPHSYIFKEKYFILFALDTGIVFGHMVSKIILAHVTKMKFPMFTILLGPLVLGSLIVNLPAWFNINPIFTAETELAYLKAFFAIALVFYLGWAWLVIDRFCTFLGIDCLTIPYNAKETVYMNGKAKA